MIVKSFLRKNVCRARRIRIKSYANHKVWFFRFDPLAELESDLKDFNSEAREVQGYFADSKLVVEINGNPNKKPLDFELDNPGSDMVVGSDNGQNSIDGLLSSLRAAELKVEVIL